MIQLVLKIDYLAAHLVVFFFVFFSRPPPHKGVNARFFCYAVVESISLFFADTGLACPEQQQQKTLKKERPPPLLVVHSLARDPREPTGGGDGRRAGRPAIRSLLGWGRAPPPQSRRALGDPR
mmetsp:Transcript_15311/g.23754  ORF Transcript_15311/g.23754 Transcript_15311/m.23754 type:complete len:123 (+) Transcript_15311:180-548(+)